MCVTGNALDPYIWASRVQTESASIQILLAYERMLNCLHVHAKPVLICEIVWHEQPSTRTVCENGDNPVFQTGWIRLAASLARKGARSAHGETLDVSD